VDAIKDDYFYQDCISCAFYLHPPPSLRDTSASGGHAMTSLFQYHKRISLRLFCPPLAGD
jgi:hypothetical protein